MRKALLPKKKSIIKIFLGKNLVSEEMYINELMRV